MTTSTLFLYWLLFFGVLGNASACQEPAGVSATLLEENENGIDPIIPRHEIPVSDQCQARRSEPCECRTKTTVHFDAHRIPRTILHTDCCRGDRMPTDVVNWRVYCKTVTSKVQVFRRHGCASNTGQYRYRPTMEKVPVGCSCASHRI